jgi:hypothetical protein
MKDIKSIYIVFENCDVANVPAKNIKKLFLREVSQYLDYEDGYTDIAHETSLIRLDLANAGDISMAYREKSLQDRVLSHNDITQIEVIDTKGVTKRFHTPWKDTYRDSYSNRYQSSHMEDEILCIDIYPRRPIRQKITGWVNSIGRFYRRTYSYIYWRLRGIK